MSDGTATGRLGPTPAAQRVATLDVLRGAAILGILLVNIELFRGARLYRVLGGGEAASTPAGDVVDFAVGWLVNGKFLSSFALLFGVGAAMTIARAQRRDHDPRSLLARRYAWLAAFGLAHMVLLFSGDILFVYAVTGALLLPFTRLGPRSLLAWAAGLLGACALLGVAAWAASALGPEPTGGDAASSALTAFLAERGEAAREAFTQGSLVDQLGARAVEAAIVQASQLLAVPWLLALFLVGLALGRSGVIGSLARRRGQLARVAATAIPVGLVLNLPLAHAGALGGSGAGSGPLEGLGLLAQIVGAPVLAVGYLAALAWLCQRPGWLARLHPLRQTGRMALTAYVLQSVLCTGLFVWSGLYGQLSQPWALGVVAAVWAVDVAACTVWLRWFAMGPVERLWRRLTYGPLA